MRKLGKATMHGKGGGSETEGSELNKMKGGTIGRVRVAKCPRKLHKRVG